MSGFVAYRISSPNEPNNFIYKGAQMQDSIFHFDTEKHFGKRSVLYIACVLCFIYTKVANISLQCIARGVAKPTILLKQAFLRYIIEYIHLQAM